MIGYYIHHVGRGHLHQALATAPFISDEVTALSSLPRDERWQGDWLRLSRDDTADVPVDPRARGLLHWAPMHDDGLQDRMARIAQWITRCRPRAMVVDVSVEVLTLARLMGVPVITVCLPGVRDDRAHALGWELADAIIAPWSREFAFLAPQLGAAHRDRIHFVGAISRFDSRSVQQGPIGGRSALLLDGLGGATDRERKAPAAPDGWGWTVLGRDHWCDDPWPLLCAADVVITHAGLGALADVAAARKPSVVIADERPFDEQRCTATALSAAGIAVTADADDDVQWPDLLDQAMRTGGAGWARWSFGDGAARAAQVIDQVALRFPRAA
jgi:hypothetical protein